MHEGNIFISNENEEKKYKVTAIIDWENAGFYPWWLEGDCDLVDIDDAMGVDTDMMHPGYTPENWIKMMEILIPIKEAWNSGGCHIYSKHKLDQSNRWLTAPFCACQPYTREIRDWHLGLENEHLDVFDVDSTDSEPDSASDDNGKTFPNYHRAFLRWFNSIQNYKPKHISRSNFSLVERKKDRCD